MRTRPGSGSLLGMPSPESGDPARPPEWFTAALAAPGRQAAVDVAGARVVYRTYGDPGDGDIVLLHGGAAHGRWGDPLAPLLAPGPPPTIVGHSMGGFVALRVASIYGSAIAGAVAIDSPVRDITPEERAARE